MTNSTKALLIFGCMVSYLLIFWGGYQLGERDKEQQIRIAILEANAQAPDVRHALDSLEQERILLARKIQANEKIKDSIFSAQKTRYDSVDFLRLPSIDSLLRQFGGTKPLVAGSYSTAWRGCERYNCWDCARLLSNHHWATSYRRDEQAGVLHHDRTSHTDPATRFAIRQSMRLSSLSR